MGAHVEQNVSSNVVNSMDSRLRWRQVTQFRIPFLLVVAIILYMNAYAEETETTLKKV